MLSCKTKLHHQPFDLESLKLLLRELFTDFDERRELDAAQLFELFDRDQDGQLNEIEAEFMWSKWIAKIEKTKCALVVIDMQNDFISGSLAVKNGADCVPVINRLIKDVPFNRLVYTLDWHPEDHISFFKNVHNYQLEQTVNGDHSGSPDSLVNVYDKVKLKINTSNTTIEQILWPVHCVEHSEGAQLHSDLIVQDNAIRVLKGISRDCDSYSAFFDNQKMTQTELDQLLKANEIDVLFVCGLATEHCVGATIEDALDLGYSTILIEDACRGIDEKVIEQTRQVLESRGCLFVTSEQVDGIVSKDVRLFDVGVQLARRLFTYRTVKRL